MRQINCHSCSLFVWSKTCGFTYLQLQDHVINHTLFVTLTKNNIIVLPQLSYCTDEIPPNFIFFFFFYLWPNWPWKLSLGLLLRSSMWLWLVAWLSWYLYKKNGSIRKPGSTVSSVLILDDVILKVINALYLNFNKCIVMISVQNWDTLQLEFLFYEDINRLYICLQNHQKA